jgi:hypothetical protein
LVLYRRLLILQMSLLILFYRWSVLYFSMFIKLVVVDFMLYLIFYLHGVSNSNYEINM